MREAKGSRGGSPAAAVTGDLVAGLGRRREEIEEAVLARVYGITDPGEVTDSQYLEGLRAAVLAGIDYGLAGIDSSDRHPPEIPAVLLVQARMAARLGVGLNVVLRRYFAGYALFSDFFIEEAERIGLDGPVQRRIIRGQGPLFDRLLDAVAEEYTRDRTLRSTTRSERTTELVEQLLGGERVDPSELGYNLGGWHLGLVTEAGGVEELGELARSLDRRMMVVRRGETSVWGWIGSQQPLSTSELRRTLDSLAWPEHVPLAFGEPCHGVSGWRLTHRQAATAFPVACQRSSRVTYGDVALLAAALQSPVLAASLHEVFLRPLECEDWGKPTALDALRAYFRASCNVSSAAALLEVNRHTVASRLRAVEECLGRSLNSCAPELEITLQLRELEASRNGDIP